MKTPSYEQIISELQREYLVGAQIHFDCHVGSLDSPIERVWLAQMLCSYWRTGIEVPMAESDWADETLREAGVQLYLDSEKDSLAEDRMVFCWSQMVCATQHWLVLPDRRIRPDFVYVLKQEPGDYTKIVVELDGHDFHERTPEQAQSDKSRDRALQALGWHVMRFTGREVLQDVAKCVNETMSLLTAKRALRWASERSQVTP